MTITAKLNSYRQSPRKVRVVARLVKGKTIDQAIDALTFLVKRAADPLKGLVQSAVANAKHNFSIERDNLFIKDFTVDGGDILYRRMPRARGTAYPIRKRTSHVTLVLATLDEKPKTKKELKKANKEVTKATPKKSKTTTKKSAK